MNYHRLSKEEKTVSIAIIAIVAALGVLAGTCGFLHR
jgi:hypothetical protein